MKKTTVGLAALTLALTVAALSAGTASAYRGNPTITGPNYSAERHAAMLEAFEDEDYTAWKNLMQDRGRVTQVITEENFAKFSEAHTLALQGKIAETQELRKELGLGLQNGSGRNSGGMMRDSGMGNRFSR